MLPNLVLIGYMGCGKSSVGRRLSFMTGHRFLDTDELVVHSDGRSIPEIFSSEGEESFRNMETSVLQDLVGVCGVIIATGGGIILREENRRILHEIGIVAWLDADPEILFDRATRSHKRPLLHTDDPRKTFMDLLAVRLPIYQAASDFRFDSTSLSHEEAAQSLLDEAMRVHARRF